MKVSQAKKTVLIALAGIQPPDCGSGKASFLSHEKSKQRLTKQLNPFEKRRLKRADPENARNKIKRKYWV